MLLITNKNIIKAETIKEQLDLKIQCKQYTKSAGNGWLLMQYKVVIIYNDVFSGFKYIYKPHYD